MTQGATENSRQESSAGTDEVPKEYDLDIAIVGGGFSGLCTAWHLLVHADLPSTARCGIIEPGARLGAGLAYRTNSPRHLLNVRARGMSMTENDHKSFVRWLSAAAPEFGADDFAPRGLYRRYITACLEQAAERKPGSLAVVRDEVCAVMPEDGCGGYRLRLKSGDVIRAATVVLAVGNLPPRTTLDNGLLLSPWRGYSDYRHIRSLAIIGTGLTALDVVLEAEASGFTGHYRIISPHGYFPRPHNEPFSPVPDELRRWAEEVMSSNPRLRLILRAFQVKRKAGDDWQHLVDSLRKFAPDIWSGFDTRDKRIFLRHLRSLWNIHLHRSFRESNKTLLRLRESGRLEQINARVTAVEKLDGHGEWAVRLMLQSGTVATLDVDAAINATGLYSSILKTDSALVAQLLHDGIAQTDEFRLGFRVNRTGKLLSAAGIRPGLFAVGTLRRGEELECTAVPEIRKQVAVMVEEIVKRLSLAATR